VYSVGVSGPKGIEETTPEAWDNTFKINISGAMMIVRAALTILETGSSIVFVSSVAAVRGTHGRLVAYTASKAGLEGLMLETAFLGRPRGIRSNILMPGEIDTGMQRNEYRGMGISREDLAMDVRQGTAWEVAYGTLYLLSNESAFVTGHILPIDGGAAAL
jgi:NAD(P)-dependent dehydrogenase (short-subunit alcohol dehydrogenase family)